VSTAAGSVSAHPDLEVAGPLRSAHRPRQFQVWLVFLVLAKAGAVSLFLLHHPVAACCLFVAPAPWFVWQLTNPGARGLGPVVTRFATDERAVWLTIDDGPDPATTPRMLDLLDAHGARATFFFVGCKAARHPELVAEVLRRGHTVGNHTLTHPCITFWHAAARRTAAEIDGCARALRHAGASATPWFRPPAGVKGLALHRGLAARDLTLVAWTTRGFDTISRRPESVVARMVRRIAPGAIILLHESSPRVSYHVEILGRLLAHLRRESYACVLPPADHLR
jgi:peptidoglycan/xylan/chitin deacetylase (PgdA/CDA1 family)